MISSISQITNKVRNNAVFAITGNITNTSNNVKNMSNIRKSADSKQTIRQIKNVMMKNVKQPFILQI